MTQAETAEQRAAVQSVLLRAGPGWTTETLRRATLQILHELRRVADRQRRRRKREAGK